MDSYRLDHLSSDYVDDLDVQVAALEIRARHRFQQERDLYRHSVSVATTKVQQYCLGLILAHRGPNSAMYAVVEEAARCSGLPVNLWTMHEVRQVWEEIILLQCVRTERAGEHHEIQDAPQNPQKGKRKAGISAPQQHGGRTGIAKERAALRPPWAQDGSSQASLSPIRLPGDDRPIGGTGKTSYNLDDIDRSDDVRNNDDAMAQTWTGKRYDMQYQSPEQLLAETRKMQAAKEEYAAAKAAADKEEEAREEERAERERMEDVEMLERERAEAAQKEKENKANGILTSVEQMEVESARDIFQGKSAPLSEKDQKIMEEAKEEFGEDFMKWGAKETKVVFNRLMVG